MKDLSKAAMDEMVRLMRGGDPMPGPLDAGGQGRSAEWFADTFANASGTRDYRLFVPAMDAGRDIERPLILMLHGCAQDPEDFAATTRMNEVAAEHGCCVLYPAQSSSANANLCWGWYETANQRPERGEPGVIAGMVRHLIDSRPIDPRRIYVAGFSAGGAMAAILAVLYPRLFAAVGVHSGLPCGAAHDLMSALIAMHQGAVTGGERRISIPMILFHGDADTTVSPLNAARLIEQAGFSAAGADAARSGSGRVQGGCNFSRSAFVGADGRTGVELWSVEGGGHGWSGGASPGIFSEPRGPDASREMLRFFLERSKDS